MKPVRFGILGTGRIARKNWRAIRLSGNSTITAVASRDLARSRAFIGECQADTPFSSAPEAFGSYEQLISSPNVDAIYIPLPTALRREWVLRAAAAGKHVVCEKPCAVSETELKEMLAACRKHKVQFMDGVMFMHSRRLERIRETLRDEASVGPIRRITSSFSFPAPPEFFAGDIRTDSALEPFGCLGDLGWYCIRLALWAMNGRPPRSVTGRILSEHRRRGSRIGVPTEFSGELIYEHGVSASFYCSFVTALQQWAHIQGTRGALGLSDFVLPFSGRQMSFEVQNAQFQVRGCDFKMNPGVTKIMVSEHSHGHKTAQETNLFRNFANQVRSGKLNQEWADLALQTQTVMCACLDTARGKKP
jgi:predicted dehydrogenase